MAPLPPARLQAFVCAFTYVGVDVDYFGPVYRQGWKVSSEAMDSSIYLSNGSRGAPWAGVKLLRGIVASSLFTDSSHVMVRHLNQLKSTVTTVHASREDLQQHKTNKVLGSTFTSARTQWLFIPPAAHGRNLRVFSMLRESPRHWSSCKRFSKTRWPDSGNYIGRSSVHHQFEASYLYSARVGLPRIINSWPLSVG